VEAEATATSRSAVSRRFVAGTQAALCELLARDLSELDVVVLMLDGVIFAEACCVVALVHHRRWDQGAGGLVVG